MIDNNPTPINAKENRRALEGTVKFNFSVFMISLCRFNYFFASSFTAELVLPLVVAEAVGLAVVFVLSAAAAGAVPPVASFCTYVTTFQRSSAVSWLLCAPMRPFP